MFYHTSVIIGSAEALPTDKQARSQGIRKGGYILRGGLGELPQKIFKFKVANTPNFNDFRMSNYLLLMMEMPDLLQAAI